MKSKWSKIIKADHAAIRIETVTLDDFQHSDSMDPDPDADRDATPQAPEEPEEPEVHDCSRLRQESYEAGFARGVEEGRAQLRAEVEAELTQALDLIAQAGLARLRALRDVENTIVELALAIAKKVIRREVTIDKETVGRHVHHVLEYLTRSTTVTIRVNPEDADRLESLCIEREPRPVSLVVERDPTMEPGGCLIETPAFVIDATVEQQLAVIHRHLTQEATVQDDGLDAAVPS